MTVVPRAVAATPGARSPYGRWKLWLSTALLLLVVAFFLIPIAFAVLVSLKTPDELAASPFSLPGELRLAHYAEVAGQMSYLRVVGNTLLITVLSSLLTLLLASSAAYPLARLQTRWSAALSQLFLLGLTLPFFVVLIPLYLLARDLGLLGTVPGIVLVYTALNLPFAIFFTVGFVRSIPRELEEASAIDGCTPFGTFRYIVLPMLRTSNATLAMFVSLGIWNDFLLPLLFFSRPEQGTVTPAVYSFVGQFSTDFPSLMAGVMLASLPLLILFILFQRQIISGITAGAVKG